MTRTLLRTGLALLLVASVATAPTATLSATIDAPFDDGRTDAAAGDGPTDASTAGGTATIAADERGDVLDAKTRGGAGGSTSSAASTAGGGSETTSSGGSSDGSRDGSNGSGSDGSGSGSDSAAGGSVGSQRSQRSKLSSSLQASLDDLGNGSAPGTQKIEVVVAADRGRGSDVARAARGLGGSVGTSYRNLREIRLPVKAVRKLASRSVVQHVREPAPPTTTGTSEGVARTNADDLHERGVTGENATIAVIDVAFEVDDPAIADQVVDAKNFGEEKALHKTSNSRHGTASAEAVADVAPNASLVLIAVDDDTDFLKAVDYVENETSSDAVTMSLGWYPSVGPLDGTDHLSQRIETSVNRSGLVWTVAAGNSGEYPVGTAYGGRHWNGTYREVGNSSIGNHRSGRFFDFGIRQGYETALPIDNFGGGDVYVAWNASWGSRENFTVHVWGKNDTEDPKKLGESNTSKPYEAFGIGGPYDEFFLEIERLDANASYSFDVFLRGGGLWFTDQYRVQRSILIPATSPDVISVGAVEQSTDHLSGYSSRGPTVDGRRGIDVAGPTNVQLDSQSDRFAGTSAAAPHVGGLAALIAGANPDASGEWIRERIEQSGREIDDDSADISPGVLPTEVGTGHVNATAALPPTVEVSTCRRISISGRYVLNGSLTNASAAPCLNVTADDATIDGRGHSIGGDGDHTGILVRGAADVTVEDLAVTNRSRGIVARNATGVELRNVAVRNATDGVDLSRTEDALVANATVETRSGFAYRVRGTADAHGRSNELAAMALPNATVSLVGENATLAGATRRPEPPGGRLPGHHVNVTAAAGYADARANLSVHYSRDALANYPDDASEEWLRLWRRDGGTWSEPNASGTDPRERVVWGNVTSFGTFAIGAPLGALEGNVTDQNGTPVPNATVGFDAASVTPATTNETGRYRFQYVPARLESTVNVSARGYDRNASVTLAVPTNDATAAPNVTLDQRAHYVGVDDLRAVGSVTEGDSFAVSATLTNFGASNWTAAVRYDRNETRVENRTASLNATERASASFSDSIGSAGTYELAVATPNETRTTTIDVEARSGGGLFVGGGSNDGDEDDGGQPDLSVASAGATDSTVAVGESVTVEATVSNDGDAAGSLDVALRADGRIVDSTTVGVDADGTATATLSTAFDEPGRYALSVEGVDAGVVEVREPREPTPTDDGSPENGTGDDAGGGDGLSGFGALPAILALLLVAAGVARRAA